MPTIPPFLLKQLYAKGSLRASDEGFEFDLRNHLATATIGGLALKVDGREIPAKSIEVVQGDTRTPADRISGEQPILFPVSSDATIRVRGTRMEPGTHELDITPTTREIGQITVSVTDQV